MTEKEKKKLESKKKRAAKKKQQQKNEANVNNNAANKDKKQQPDGEVVPPPIVGIELVKVNTAAFVWTFTGNLLSFFDCCSGGVRNRLKCQYFTCLKVVKNEQEFELFLAIHFLYTSDIKIYAATFLMMFQLFETDLTSTATDVPFISWDILLLKCNFIFRRKHRWTMP